MSLTRELFLYFIQNKTGQSYYRNAVGNIAFRNIPTWLPQAPDGWFDQTLSFARNTHYWGMNRSYSQQYTFYKDGSDILRNLIYRNTGLKDNITLVVNKYDDGTDVYEPYYKGELDLQNMDDEVATGVKVSVLEGGLQKLIKAYENTIFEIPCDGSIVENNLLEIDGYKFNAIFEYHIPDFQLLDKGMVMPAIYSSTIGSDVGITKANSIYQGFLPADLFTFFQHNPNLIFSSNRALTGVTVSGQIILNSTLTSGNVFIYTSNSQKHDLIPLTTSLLAGTYNVSVTFDLLAGENVYLVILSASGTPTFSASTLHFNFDSKFDNTFTYVIKPKDLLKLVVNRICQEASILPNVINYDIVCSILEQNANLSVTSGSSLRNELKATVKTSLSEIYDAYYVQLQTALGINRVTTGLGEVLFLERLAYALDTSAITMDLGEVSGLKVELATDLMFDKLLIGYPEQKYDEKQGNYEINTTAQFKAPLTPFNNLNKELKIISPYRGDMFGAEYTRFLINGSNTTNNKSDNDTFILNTDYSKNSNTDVSITSTPSIIKAPTGSAPLQQVAFALITGGGIAADFSKETLNSANDIIRYNNSTPITVSLIGTFTGVYNGTIRKKPVYGSAGFVIGFTNYPQVDVYIQLIKSGTVIASSPATTIYDTKTFSYTFNETFQLSFGEYFQIAITLVNPSDPAIYLCFEVKSATSTITLQTSLSGSTYLLKRVIYDDAGVGLPNLDTAYNIEDMTPMRLLAKHGDYIRSCLFNYTNLSLSFLTTNKNHILETTLNGVTTIENINVPIGNLNPNLLFYPFYFTFRTKVPVNFNELLETSANGHIQFSFNGTIFYGFPQQVKQQPAIDEVQEWKLLCSPATNIEDIKNIDFTGLNQIDLMSYGIAVSYLNPVKFYPLDFTKPAAYNIIHADQDLFSEQQKNLTFPASYNLKWQKTDTIPFQVLTNALSPVVGTIYDTCNVEIDTFNFVQKTDPAVKAPFILWEAQYALSGIDEGIYQLKITAGIGDTLAELKSELIDVKDSHPNTFLFEYSDTRNKLGMVFTTGFIGRLRVEGNLFNYDSDSNYSQFEDQPADLELVNGIPFDLFQLVVGWRSQGVPPYIRKIIEMILLMESCEIDGLEFTRSKDAKFEKQDIAGWGMANWSILIRNRVNQNSLTVTTDGSIDDQMVITHNINTKLFGDGNIDNTIQVESIN